MERAESPPTSYVFSPSHRDTNGTLSPLGQPPIARALRHSVRYLRNDCVEKSLTALRLQYVDEDIDLCSALVRLSYFLMELLARPYQATAEKEGLVVEPEMFFDWAAFCN